MKPKETLIETLNKLTRLIDKPIPSNSIWGNAKPSIEVTLRRYLSIKEFLFELYIFLDIRLVD